LGLLKKAVNQTCFLKAGILGFAGAGKTFTASELGIGMCRLTNNNKAAFFDTETGSDFMIPRFKNANVDLFVHKGKAFMDLCNIVREAEKDGFAVLVIDSISHVWGELMSAYMKKNRLKFLTVSHIGKIKTEWQTFSDLYVNSKLHIIMCGRAGYEWGHEENEETGKKELIKKGIKMKAESEIGFEPSLLLEMERVQDQKHRIKHHCHILKDRSDNMNGKTVINPKFKHFMPHIDFLNIGGEHVGVDTERNSQAMFDNPDWSKLENKKRKEILIDELEEVLVLHDLWGTSKDVKKKRVEILIECFGTSGHSAIEAMDLSELGMSLEKLKLKLNPIKEGDPPALDVDEEIPSTISEPKFDSDEKIPDHAPGATQ